MAKLGSHLVLSCVNGFRHAFLTDKVRDAHLNIRHFHLGTMGSCYIDANDKQVFHTV